MKNALIETLAKQSGMVEYPTGLGISENTIWGDRNIQKFAELIVRECVKCGSVLTAHYIEMHTEKDQAMLLASISDYSSEIEKHFGVE